MKTKKQIEDRITHLESRMKDGLDVKDKLSTLRWALIASEKDIKEEIYNTANNSYSASNKLDSAYMGVLMWVLEN